MSELNPCPICGCSVRVWAKRFDEEDMEYIIECDNDFCGLTYGISCGYNRDEIEKAWNSVTALSPTVSKDCISRQQAIEVLAHVKEDERWRTECIDNEIRLIESLPPVVPDFKTFCGMPIKEAIEVLEKYKHSPTVKVQQADTLIIAAALWDFAQDSERKIRDRERAEELREQVLAYGASMCKPVTPTEQQEHGRLIDADKLLQDLFIVDEEEWTTPEIRAILENAPNITPTERTTETMIVDGMEMEIDPVSYEVGYTHGQTAPTERTGEWIKSNEHKYECPFCHVDFGNFGLKMNYCPNCGADMRGGTENE